MSVTKAKPTSPGRRFVVSVKRDLYKGKPYKPLTEKKSKNGGRYQNDNWSKIFKSKQAQFLVKIWISFYCI